MHRKTLILVSLLIAAFVINLDTTMVNVALPALERQLGATTTQLQWVVDAYNLVFAALLLSAWNLSSTAWGAGACSSPACSSSARPVSRARSRPRPVS